MYVIFISYFYISLGNREAAYWDIASHSPYDMLFSWYKYLSVILVFPTPRFMEWEFLSDCAIS